MCLLLSSYITKFTSLLACSTSTTASLNTLFNYYLAITLLPLSYLGLGLGLGLAAAFHPLLGV